jgi:hypothetical protein
MIRYVTTPRGIKVYLGRKLVGKIIQVENGFAYLPVGSRHRGETLPSVAAVKRSLEIEG